MKTAIVTGASSGIGKAIAEVLVKNGYEVYGIGRNFTEDVRFHAIVCDLLDEKQYQAMMLSLPKEIDVLVNNAGCAYYGMHETMSDARIHEMIKLNLEIPERMSQHYIRALRLRQGMMINVASITGTHPSPHAACYASTKAAMISFSNSETSVTSFAFFNAILGCMYACSFIVKLLSCQLKKNKPCKIPARATLLASKP